MKTAFVKQHLDVFGPWSSVQWEDTSPEKLLDIWPCKTTYWDMTCALKADWYIVPQILETDYIKDAVLRYPGRKSIIEKYTLNVVAPETIPFEDYDIVISLDPILMEKSRSPAMMAYFMNEHWDSFYRQSKIAPLGGYDLFLAHMMDAGQDLDRLPQAMSFPYMRSPEIVRSLFGKEKEDSVWLDWRTLVALSMAKGWTNAAEEAAGRVEKRLKMPVRYVGEFNKSPYGVSDPPMYGDGAEYLKALGKCKYYVSVGRYSGGGQGLCDAASLGAICVGEKDKAFHRLVCHPECLCDDMADMPERFGKIVSDENLQKEIALCQDEKLHVNFIARPMEILKKAVELKKTAS